MNTGTFHYPGLLAALVVGSVVLIFSVSPVHADNLQVPWECSNYEGDAQTRCMNAFMEAQQKKIAELEGKLQAQQSTVGQLKEQLDRQSAATTNLQRQLAERPATTVVPFSYGYPYSYALPPILGLGFGLHFGSTGLYASPYPYYRPFLGPRHYDYWGYRW